MFVFRCSMLVLSKMQKTKNEHRITNIEKRTSNIEYDNNKQQYLHATQQRNPDAFVGAWRV